MAGEVGDTYTSPLVLKYGRPLAAGGISQSEKSYKSRSVFGHLISETVKCAFLDNLKLIYGTPNTKSYPGYTKHLNFITHEKYSNTTYYRPRAQLVLKDNIMSKNFISFANKFDDVIVNFRNSLRRHHSIDVIVQKNTPEKIEIDNLWHSSKPRVGFSLVRDFEY